MVYFSRNMEKSNGQPFPSEIRNRLMEKSPILKEIILFGDIGENTLSKTREKIETDITRKYARRDVKKIVPDIIELQILNAGNSFTAHGFIDEEKLEASEDAVTRYGTMLETLVFLGYEVGKDIEHIGLFLSELADFLLEHAKGLFFSGKAMEEMQGELGNNIIYECINFGLLIRTIMTNKNKEKPISLYEEGGLLIAPSESRLIAGETTTLPRRIQQDIQDIDFSGL